MLHRLRPPCPSCRVLAGQTCRNQHPEPRRRSFASLARSPRHHRSRPHDPRHAGTPGTPWRCSVAFRVVRLRAGLAPAWPVALGPCRSLLHVAPRNGRAVVAVSGTVIHLGLGIHPNLSAAAGGLRRWGSGRGPAHGCVLGRGGGRGRRHRQHPGWRALGCRSYGCRGRGRARGSRWGVRRAKRLDAAVSPTGSRALCAAIVGAVLAHGGRGGRGSRRLPGRRGGHHCRRGGAKRLDAAMTPAGSGALRAGVGRPVLASGRDRRSLCLGGTPANERSKSGHDQSAHPPTLKTLSIPSQRLGNVSSSRLSQPPST